MPPRIALSAVHHFKVAVLVFEIFNLCVLSEKCGSPNEGHLKIVKTYIFEGSGLS